MAWRSVLKVADGDVDIFGGQEDEDKLAADIVRHVALKGFCVLSLTAQEIDAERAVDEARTLEDQSSFREAPEAVAEGLLGSEGSARIAELPQADGQAAEQGALAALEQRLRRIGAAVEASAAGRLRLDAIARTGTLLHRAGELQDLAPEPVEKEAMDWLSIFLRHKLMVVVFLGPEEGALELRPHDSDDALVHRVSTAPGTVVILRPDLLSHRHSAWGESFAMSFFSLAGHVDMNKPLQSRQPVPAARDLHDWIMSRLQRFRGADEQLAGWDAEVPRSWRRAVNDVHRVAQMVAVRAASCRFASGDFPDSWFRLSIAGPDYATSVPTVRWDHSEVYDPDPEGWKNNKSYCRHASFVDGIDNFDFLAFGLPASEAVSMDPHQRLTLEVGYAALAQIGLRRGATQNWVCGVYVGCGNNEWMFKDSGLQQAAKMLDSGAGVSSGRFSFVLGLRGPNLTVDTEASSGLVAAQMAAEAVGRRGGPNASDYAVAAGVHLCLSPVWWPTHCASGWLSRVGRCLTFDASASGYVRGEGCAALIMSCFAVSADGGLMDEGGGPVLGCIAGAMMSSSGGGASLSTPNGPAEQEVMAEAIRRAHVSPLDLDGVEAHGSGCLLADAIEAGSLQRVHRPDGRGHPLLVGAAKTSACHQVECGGLASLLRPLLGSQCGLAVPALHLRSLNPHIDAVGQPMLFSSEAMEVRERSTYVGVFARGFGGSNAYLVTWGQLSEDRVQPTRAVAVQETLAFWPAGGGRLERELRPMKAYTVTGTFCEWGEAYPMETEGSGNYGFTVELGENGWEQFQIWLDGDQARVLHPGRGNAPEGSAAFGPEPGAVGRHWRIEGACGDRFRVRLRVAGRWRAVCWDRLPLTQEEEDERQRAPSTGSSARYYLSGSWNDWGLHEMARDPSTTGLFWAEVKLLRDGGDFQIVRNRDWSQVLHPAKGADGSDHAGPVAGPDEQGAGLNWQLKGRAGEAFRVEFKRVREQGQDLKTVAWRRQLEDGPAPAAAAPSGDSSGSAAPPPARYCVIGTWDGWQAPIPMEFDGKCYRLVIQLGGHAEESFQILKDGLWELALFPNIRGANPHSFHTLQGPRVNNHGLSWSIGRHEKDEARPGAEYEVRLLLSQDGSRPKKVEWQKVVAAG